MSLYELFCNNKGRNTSKWSQYFPAYERHFSRFINHSFVFLEIGVRYGGSLPLWRQYFGPNAIIVGIDIDEECKLVEDKSQNIYVEAYFYHMQLGLNGDLSWAPLQPLGSWYNPVLFKISENPITFQSQSSWVIMTPIIYCLSIYFYKKEK